MFTLSKGAIVNLIRVINWYMNEKVTAIGSVNKEVAYKNRHCGVCAAPVRPAR